MNIKTLLLALISVLMLSGCALIKNSNEEKINTITPVGSAKFEAYGAERMDALGMVATKVDSRCSAVEFFKSKLSFRGHSFRTRCNRERRAVLLRCR